MKNTYTKSQIAEAIDYWERQLKMIDERQYDANLEQYVDYEEEPDIDDDCHEDTYEAKDGPKTLADLVDAIEFMKNRIDKMWNASKYDGVRLEELHVVLGNLNFRNIISKNIPIKFFKDAIVFCTTKDQNDYSGLPKPAYKEISFKNIIDIAELYKSKYGKHALGSVYLATYDLDTKKHKDIINFIDNHSFVLGLV